MALAFLVTCEFQFARRREWQFVTLRLKNPRCKLLLAAEA
jgi:hypothetical protein